MKKNNGKTAAWVIAALTSLGVAHAEGAKVLVPAPTDLQLRLIQDLLDQGIISAMQHENWYQLNHERLKELMDKDSKGDQAAHFTVEVLKLICGPDTNIEEVDIFDFSHGSQDVSAGK